MLFPKLFPEDTVVNQGYREATETGMAQSWPEKAGLGHLPLNQLGRDNEVLAAEGSGKNRDFGLTHLFRR